jgi:RNA polymerase sigma-54 factor
MKQTMGMTMTPQLQQAIKILQMSVMELQQEVNSALVENPTLEEITEEDSQSPEEVRAEVSDQGDGGEGSAVDNLDKLAANDSPEGAKDDLDWQALLDQGNWNSPMPSTRTLNSDDIPSYEQVLSRPQSLGDHLMWQLRMSTTDAKVTEIAEEIVGNLNEDGYLVVLIEELAERLKVDKSEVEAVLFTLQRFDPPGVAARDLQECLLIQAGVLDEDDEVEIIIERHMPELENKNYGAIAKAMDLPIHRVIELCKVIHAMEPRPGRSFATTEPQYIVPDIYVLKVGAEFVVVLNEEGIPRLRVSKDYQHQLTTGQLAGETKQYVKEKLKGAVWLMRSILQRQRTIFRVTECLVKRQKDFFDQGPQSLKPMVLRDIADELGLHESTISRVTTNKFVHTPHGIFELKYFFNSAISRGDGEDDMASESVRQKIRELIGSENAKNPISDQQIADTLKDLKINIARRTIAKYREAMGILPSNKRKKFF